MRLAFLIAVVGLSACASAPPAPKTIWLHNSLAGPAAERQFQIDAAECEAAAYQTVALPSAPPSPYLTPRREYEVTGQTTGYGVPPTQYTATVRERPNYNVMGAFAAGQEMRRYDDAVELRARVGNACMLRRGWHRGLPGEVAGPETAMAIPAVASSQVEPARSTITFSRTPTGGQR